MSPWKPLPEDPAARDPRPVSDSLPGLAGAIGAPPPAVLTTIFARWEEIVGPLIAAHAWPLSLSGGVLRIAVDQPGWATQLRFLAADLLQRVSSAAGESAVEQVVVKVVPERR